MSQEIDERVVEMRFDNAQFEKNTRQSIKTLNELNESLKLEGAEKGFEKIDDAAAKVDFDRMQSALENLNSKFSAVEVMGVTALMRITNQAIDTGEKLVKSLSIDQVTAGWNKYAQKTASVQTIMNATGKSITKVNGYLDKLMWFSDETSYGFTDMTAALSTLTSAGGDIEKMIPMIIGMANATAYAGKGAAEFQRVIYNLAQSYGTGAIQLIDWKSVEQAGVASQQLKQLLIDTGVELGKIKKGDVTTGSFDNSLQKKWADQQVMETAFGKYAEFAEAVKAELDANPNKYHNQASLAIEAIADQYDEVTVKAFKAAQEAKSFSEAVDATKDAVSSGWMETFDILFGNYEEAKGFWSDLAEEFWTMFAGGAAGRNNWLKSAFDSGLDQLLGTDGFGDASDSYTNLLRKALVNQGLLTEEAIEDAGSFQKALEESGVTAQQLYDVIGGAAEHYAKRAGMSDKELDKLGLDRDKVEKLAKAYGSMAEKIQNGNVNLEEFSGKMNQLSGREHFFNGILNILDGINSVLTPMRDAFSEVFMTDGSPLYNFLKGFDELTGKMQMSEGTAKKVQEVFKGFFSVLNTGFKAVKIAGKTAFALAEKLLDLLSPVTDLLLNIGSAIGNVLSWVDQSMGQAESLTDVIAILVTAIGALASPIGEVLKGFKSIVRGGSVEDAKQQFGAFGAIVNAVGSVLEKFKIGSVSASGIIGKAVTVLGGVLTLAFDGVGALIGSAFSGFQDAGETVKNFKESHVPMLENIRDTVLSIPEKATEVLADFGGTLGGIMSNIAGACKTALGAVKEFFNLQDGVDIYRLLALLDVGALSLSIWAIYKGLNGISGTINKIRKDMKGPITNFFDSLTSAVDAWKKKNLTNNFVTIAKGIGIAITAISGSMYMLSKIEDPTKALQALGSVMAMLFGLVVSMKALAKTDVSGLDSAKIFAVVVAFGVGMLAITASIKGIAKAVTIFENFDTQGMNNAVGALMAIVAVLGSMVAVVGAFNYLTNKLMASSKIKMGDALKGMSSYLVAATALVEVCGALYLIGNLDEGKLQDAYGAILTLGLTMSGMVAVMGALNHWNNSLQAGSDKKLKTVTNGISSFIVVAAALIAAAKAVNMFAQIDNLDNAMGAALGMLVTMAGAIAAMSRFGGKAKKMKAGAAAMLLASSSLIVMAGALALMSEAMKADESGAGFAGLSIALIALGAAIYVLGKNAMESMGAAAALVAMGLALIEMAQAINMLADLNPGQIASGIISIGLAMLVLVGGCALLPTAAAGILSIAAACLMLATALLILTPAFKGLASLNLQQVTAGVVGMVALLLGLGAIGANPEIETGMVSLSASLKGLAKAFNVFAGGLIKLSIAAGILAVLAKFAYPVCQVIIEAEPEIEEALIAVVTGICNVIVACAEPVAKALFVLAVALTEAIVYYIALILGVADVSMEGGLDQVWDNLAEWFDNHHLIDLFKVWAANATDALKNWNPFGMFTVNLDGIFGNAGAALGNFVNKIDEVLGTGIMDSIRKAWGFETIPIEEYEKANNENTSANNENTDAKAANTKATKSQTVAVQTATSATKENTDGLVQLVSDTGEMITVTEEQARAMLNGADATANAGTEVETATAIAVNSAGRLDATARQIDSKSGELENKVDEKAEEGFSAGNETTEEKGEETVTHWYDSIADALEKWFPGAKENVNNTVSKLFGDIQLPSANDILNGSGVTIFGSGNNDSVWKGLLGNGDKTGLTDEDYDEEGKKDPGTATTNSTNSTSTTKKSSSGTKKTVAQQIEEKYKTQLSANKTLREALDSEYELWETENQYSADADTLLSKKMENAAAEIANQTDRVAIAQAKYDELYSKWGKDKEETKEAYTDLLSEQVNLAKLKAEQYTNLFEEITKRYDTDLDTLEKQYNLWTAQNDGTVSKLDKIERETQYQTDELEIKQKKEEKAKEQWETLKEKHGETDLRTKEAYNDYLDTQTETLEIQNELAKQALNKLDAQIELIQDAQSRMQSKMGILSTVFDDGSLSERESAYKSAVEEYGKDSEQARKAQFQGTTSAILSTVTAMQNLNYQMQNNQKLWEKMQELEEQDKKNSDEYKQAQSDLLSSQSAFIGFASNLADALNMDDTAKRAMLIFANSIQKKENWQHISDAFQKVMAKAAGGMSEGMKQGLSDMFGWMSNEGMDMETEFISAISSALQGDWAGALASAFAFGMDLAFSEAGINARKWIGEKLMPGIQNGLEELGKAMNGEDGIVSIISKGMQGVDLAVEGSGGITEVLGSIGATLTEVGGTLMSFLAEFWWVFLILAAIAAVIGGIAWFVSSRKKQDSGVTVGEEFDKEVSSGITDGSDKVNDAVEDMTEDAVDIARKSLATISKTMDDDYEYEPQIVPVVDLSNVVEAAGEANTAFEATAKAMSLDDDVTRQMAAQIETQAEIQNELKQASNADTLSAINALGDHMDGVAESIRGMSVNINGRKAIGYIDSKLGQRTAAKVR